MQTESIKEMLMQLGEIYFTLAAWVFIACVLLDRYDKWTNTNYYDHKSFPFYICILMYVWYSILWMPYLLTELRNKIIKKEYS